MSEINKYQKKDSLTRRELIRQGVALGVGASALGVLVRGGATLTPFGGLKPASAVAAPQTDLNFLVWTYSVETIQENLNAFQKQNPSVKVNLKDVAWGEYHSGVVARMTAKTPTDVLYGSDHWLHEWASAGWIVPLEDTFPQIRSYVPELAPFSVQGMTYKGKLYGLPYYSDTIDFMYNARHLSRAGIKGAPASWAELASQAKQLKAKGVSRFPVALAFSQSEPFSSEIFTAMVYSEGGKLFDADFNPVFAEAGNPATKVVEWVRQGLRDGIISPDALTASEPDVLKGLQAGTHTYTFLPSYDLADLNNPASSKVAGQFRMALVPGSTHNTVGYARFYALTKMAQDRGPETTQAGWKLIEYLGGKTNGKYLIAKKWAVEKGLGFAPIPLLDDPDVRKAFSKWVNVDVLRQQVRLAKGKDGLSPFYGVWEVKARKELQQAYIGKQPTASALQALSNEWMALKKKS